MFNSIRWLCNGLLFSDTTQGIYEELLIQDREFNTTIPHGIDDWTWVPIQVVWQFINESYVSERHEKDPERIERHVESLTEQGWTEPITISYDENGKVTVKDGNHRMMAAINMDFTHVPIKLLKVPAIRKGASIAGLIEALFEGYGETTRYQLKTRDYIFNKQPTPLEELVV